MECKRIRFYLYMKRMGLKAVQAKAFKVTTNSKHDKPVYPDLLERDTSTTGINQKWVSGVSYSVPGVQGKHGCLNEPRVYLKYMAMAA